jgi:hypothetical protein
MKEATNEIESVEISIEDAKQKIELRDALARLIENKDFKTIVDNGYFEGEAIRLVHLKADPNMQDPEQQDFVIKAIDAVGFFRAYLSRIFQQGNTAEGALKSHEQTLEEILAEDLVSSQVAGIN